MYLMYLLAFVKYCFVLHVCCKENISFMLTDFFLTLVLAMYPYYYPPTFSCNKLPSVNTKLLADNYQFHLFKI